MYLFAECQSRHSAKFSKCRVYGTRHYNIFAECPKLTLGEACFCRVLPSWHSANNNGNGRGKMGTFVATACAGHVTEFAEWVPPCRHSANKSSPHRNGRLRASAGGCGARDGIYRVSTGRHSAKCVFAECQLAGTRQRDIPPSASCSPSACCLALGK